MQHSAQKIPIGDLNLWPYKAYAKPNQVCMQRRSVNMQLGAENENRGTACVAIWCAHEAKPSVHAAQVGHMKLGLEKNR